MSIRVVKLDSGSEWGVIQNSSDTFFAPVFASEISARIFAEHYRRTSPFDGEKSRAEWEPAGQVAVADSVKEYVSVFFGTESRVLLHVVEGFSDLNLWREWRHWLYGQQEQRKAQAAQEFSAIGQ